MKNMPREEIEKIATYILNSGDIIAKHGTSVKNALSIINTGFNYHRTSFVVQKNKNIEGLCGYGWKENGPDDSANVVIEIPREFIMDLLSIDDAGYQNFIQNIIDNNLQNNIIDSVATFEIESSQEENVNNSKSLFIPIKPSQFLAHIPKEFIVGTFIWCNGKTYSRLKNGESALDNLSFVPNDNFYLNLHPDVKNEFIHKLRKNLDIEESEKSL